jgi:hypothetical protein
MVLALLAPGACTPQEGYGGYAVVGSGAGGDRGEDGSAPDESDESGVGGEAGSRGGDTGGGGAMNCSALPFGCVCSPTEPSQVGACTAESVLKTPGQQGVCCDNSFYCTCVAYECVLINGASCACQLADKSLGGTRADDCGATTVNAAVKCCRSYGQCVCSTADCLFTETQVSGCSVQDLLACDVGSARVQSCETSGAGGSAAP